MTALATRTRVADAALRAMARVAAPQVWAARAPVVWH